MREWWRTVSISGSSSNRGNYVGEASFWERLTDARLNAGLLKLDVAGYIGVGEITYGAWERGRHLPINTRTFPRLSEMLRIPLVELEMLWEKAVSERGRARVPHSKHRWSWPTARAMAARFTPGMQIPGTELTVVTGEVYRGKYWGAGCALVDLLCSCGETVAYPARDPAAWALKTCGSSAHHAPKPCAHPGCPRLAVSRGLCEMHASRERRGSDRPPCSNCGGELIGKGLLYLCQDCYDAGVRHCSYKDHAGRRVMSVDDMLRDRNTCRACTLQAAKAGRAARRKQWAPTLAERRVQAETRGLLGGRCRRGHKYTAANTYIKPDGTLICYKCKNQDQNKARARDGHLSQRNYRAREMGLDVPYRSGGKSTLRT